MLIRILHAPVKLSYYARKDCFEAQSISLSPDSRYAVVFLGSLGPFVAVKLLESAPDGTSCGEYLDSCRGYDEDIPMLMKYSVDWDMIGFGFCKLVLFAPEMSEKFGGAFSGTVHRFYFDRALYERKRKELHPS